LYVGRVSYEKNIKAFLNLDLKGSKVVCGVGPVLSELQAQYDHVCWLGVLDRTQLSQVYGAADVFVFPSLNETFGLVMLEAMSTGTPVAAFPVDGPLQVLERKDEHQRQLGGALSHSLDQAVKEALLVKRADARLRALDFDWQQASNLFLSYLVDCSAS
jgi:glycosyltransferase involved in cell wall biosynthesis